MKSFEIHFTIIKKNSKKIYFNRKHIQFVTFLKKGLVLFMSVFTILQYFAYFSCHNYIQKKDYLKQHIHKFTLKTLLILSMYLIIFYRFYDTKKGQGSFPIYWLVNLVIGIWELKVKGEMRVSRSISLCLKRVINVYNGETTS